LLWDDKHFKNPHKTVELYEKKSVFLQTDFISLSTHLLIPQNLRGRKLTKNEITDSELESATTINLYQLI
jgi:hypothetical protein